MVLCLICTNDVEFERVFDIPCLWYDNCYKGKPVCNECLKILIELVAINKKITLTWGDEANPCRTKIRKELGLIEKKKGLMKWIK
jgi:hypothetical protein